MHGECECDVCREMRQEGISLEEALKRRDLRDAHIIEQAGWVGHIIVDGARATSVHTHGLDQFGHPDLEVVLPARPETLARLIKPLANAVKAGRRLRAGEEVTDLFNVPVRLAAAKEGRRDVLRAIFPDPEGRWPEDPLCSPGYREQLNDIEEG